MKIVLVFGNQWKVKEGAQYEEFDVFSIKFHRCHICSQWTVGLLGFGIGIGIKY